MHSARVTAVCRNVVGEVAASPAVVTHNGRMNMHGHSCIGTLCVCGEWDTFPMHRLRSCWQNPIRNSSRQLGQHHTLTSPVFSLGDSRKTFCHFSQSRKIGTNNASLRRNGLGYRTWAPLKQNQKGGRRDSRRTGLLRPELGLNGRPASEFLKPFSGCKLSTYTCR